VDRPAIDEAPQPGVEAAELGLDGQEGAGVVIVEAIFRRLRTMPGLARRAASSAGPKRATCAGSKPAKAAR
jgi:hypothetical protein